MPSPRRTLRKQLHANLDVVLNGTITDGDREVGVLDALLERAGQGYALQVRIHTEAPKPAPKPLDLVH